MGAPAWWRFGGWGGLSGSEDGLGSLLGWWRGRELVAAWRFGEGVAVGVVDVDVAVWGAPEPVAAFVDGVVVVSA